MAAASALSCTFSAALKVSFQLKMIYFHIGLVSGQKQATYHSSGGKRQRSHIWIWSSAGALFIRLYAETDGAIISIQTVVCTCFVSHLEQYL